MLRFEQYLEALGFQRQVRGETEQLLGNNPKFIDLYDRLIGSFRTGNTPVRLIGSWTDNELQQFISAVHQIGQTSQDINYDLHKKLIWIDEPFDKFAR